MDFEAEINDLKLRVSKLEGPTVPSPVGTLQVVATPLPGKVQVAWAPPLGRKVIKFEATRGGVDSSGTGPWTGVFPASTRTTTFNRLRTNTEYLFTVVAFYDDGTQEAVMKRAMPLAPVVVPPEETTERSVRPVGHSGQPFNLLAFSGGSMPVAEVVKQGDIVHNRLDGAMMFTGRHEWKAFRDERTADAARSNLSQGKLFVITMPHAPETIGRGMNKLGAENKFRDEQKKIGEWLAAEEINHPDIIVRLNHEFNGHWYNWSTQYGGKEALRDAMGHYMDNLRAGGADKVKFDLCANVKSGAPFSTWEDVIPGPGYFDILAIDEYDAYPPVRGKADWEQHMVQPLSIREGIKIAKRNNAMFAVDECGAMHHSGGAYDNPEYWNHMFAELRLAAPHIAWMVIYNHDGAPATNKHSWIYNPKALARFREILKAQKLS